MDLDKYCFKFTVQLDAHDDEVKMSGLYNLDHRNEEYNFRDVPKMLELFKKMLIAADMPKNIVDRVIFATPDNIAKLNLLE